MEILKQVETFTLETAIETAQKGTVRDWVIGFLEGIGRNAELAKGIRNNTQHFIGPVLTPLKRLERIAGPERSMIYRKPQRIWRREVRSMRDSIQKGWTPPPLITVDFFTRPDQLADGNKRHQALTQLGIREYWVIYCMRTLVDYNGEY